MVHGPKLNKVEGIDCWQVVGVWTETDLQLNEAVRTNQNRVCRSQSLAVENAGY